MSDKQGNIQSLLSPILKFRYFINFLDYPETNFEYLTGNSIKLPKWTIKDGWKNEVSIKFYGLRMNPSIETLLIGVMRKPIENRIRVNFVEPDTTTVFGYWDILGDIEVVDFGDMTWKSDDILELEMKVMPISCEYVEVTK